VAEDTPGGPSARIISPAVPPLAPSSPKKIPTLVIALVAGLGLGIALALMLDFVAAARRRAMARAETGAERVTRRERIEEIVEEEAPRSRARPAQASDPAFKPEAAAELEDSYAAPPPPPPRRSDEARRTARGEGDLSPVRLDLAAFEDDPFAEASRQDEASRMREEVKVWRMLDAAGAELADGLRSVALLDVSARPREGLSTRVATALARAAAARGDRVLALAGKGSLALDALLASEAAGSVEVDGRARVAAPVAETGGRAHVAAPPGVAPSREERRRSLGEARKAFDLLIHDGPAEGGTRAELCARADATFVLIGPRDTLERADQARAAIERAGGVFGGVVMVGAQPRRPGARSAA
jgi:hypothetical protein